MQKIIVNNLCKICVGYFFVLYLQQKIKKQEKMKIYYDVDEITDNCKHDCPFKDIGFKGETGGECKVGSVACQECKFCYGHHDSHRHSLVFVNNNIHLRTMPYIKCMWGTENPWREKIEQFFYRIKQWLRFDNY